MIRREVTIINTLGLHARPAARLVKIAAAYPAAKFWISRDRQRINGKSIMGVMMLAAERGATIVIEADGDGEQQLINEIVELIENKFHEE